MEGARPGIGAGARVRRHPIPVDQNPGLYQDTRTRILVYTRRIRLRTGASGAHPFADWRQRSWAILAPAVRIRLRTGASAHGRSGKRSCTWAPWIASMSAEGRAPSVAVTPLPLALVSPAPRRLHPCRLPARTALPRADLCTPPRRCTRRAEHPRSIGGPGVGYLECMRAWVS
jgi:hypothetical protein